MRNCVNSRLRLPNLIGIQIDKISDADTDLTSFFSDCTPAKLKLLNVNYYAISWTGIKSKFYVDAFSGAAARTKKISLLLLQRLQLARPADRRQGYAQRRENCVQLVLHPLLFGPRLRGRPHLQHQILKFSELRTYGFQREDDGLEGKPKEILVYCGRDQQLRTESQSEEAQHLRQSDFICIKSAGGAELEEYVAHFRCRRVDKLTHFIKWEWIQATDLFSHWKIYYKSWENKIFIYNISSYYLLIFFSLYF